MSDPICKFVKPAHPGAKIPDLAHGNDLPPDGTEVVWDAYWIAREMTGDIVVVDPAAPAALTVTVTAPDPATPAA